MTRSGLIADLKCILHDASDKFATPRDGDFDRHVSLAVLDLSRVRPRVLKESLTLVAGTDIYPAPADLRWFRSSDWGIRFRRQMKQWDEGYPGRIPRVRAMQDGSGRILYFDTVPTAGQITCFGSDFVYFYDAQHVVNDDPNGTTVHDADRGLLLLRATAEAMKELANRNNSKPVQLRDGLQSAPKNGTPAALYKQLMDDFKMQAA